MKTSALLITLFDRWYELIYREKISWFWSVLAFWMLFNFNLISLMIGLELGLNLEIPNFEIWLTLMNVVGLVLNRDILLKKGYLDEYRRRFYHQPRAVVRWKSMFGYSFIYSSLMVFFILIAR